MRAVNLLPADATQRKSFRGPGLVVIAFVGLFAVVLGVLGMTYLSARSTVGDKQAELASLHAQIAAVPQGRRPLSAAEQQLASDRSTRVQALNAALTGRVSWDRVLRQVSLVLPSDVWLTDLSGAAPVAPTPAPITATSTPTTPAPVTSGGSSCGSGSFCISGYTYSQESVARLLTRLAVVPSLSNVELDSSAAQGIGKQTVYQFHVHADLSSGGGA